MSVMRPALLQRITFSIGLSLSIASVLFAGDREVICFPDCSTSMQGQPIEAVKESLRLFAAIAENDVELRVVAFNHDIRDSGSLSLGTPAGRSSHQAFVNSIVAHGGTEYLPALMAHEWPPGSVGVFLSDGAPQGSPEEVLAAINSRLKGRLQLHCIGVNCGESQARDLLIEIAATTGGSFVDARTSEEIVERFVELGVQYGDYRSHRPAESSLQLRRAVGRVLVFAYDAEIEIQATRPVKISRHVARLPGEAVSMASVECGEATDLSISVLNPTSATSRLGDVFVADLPVQTFDVDAPNGTVGTNSQVHATFGFQNSQGQAVSAGNLASAQVDVLNTGGQIIDTVVAKPVFGGHLDAIVNIPAEEGALTLRGVSSWLRDGLEFSQSTEKTVLVRQMSEIEVAPAKVTGRHSRGQAFHVPIKVRRKGSGEPVDPKLVKIAAEANGIKVVSLTPASDSVDVELTSEQAGSIAGELKVTAELDGLVAAAEVSLDLLIEATEKGLKQPLIQQLTLPDTYAGSKGSTEIGFLTDDKPEISYQIELTDAGSGTAAIPMQLDTQAIQVSADRGGRVIASWDAAGVLPGQYKAKLTASTASLPDVKWVTELTLPVKSSLTADAIEFGDVSSGQVAKAIVCIVNHSDTPVTGITLVRSKSDDDVSKHVHLKLDDRAFVIPAKGQRKLPLELLFSPPLSQFGKHETTVDVMQGNHRLLQIPLKLTIADISKSPAFSITPNPVSLQGKPGDVLEFQLLVRAEGSLRGPTELTGDIGGFRDSMEQASRITASVIADGSGKLRSTGTSVKFKGIVICPRLPGSYVGQIEMKGSNGEKSSVEVKLAVK